ncbi:hypothetical protein HJC23_011605 [Cyclotella cryptica]|uniref:Uncharacterized protein n=1 Tax=Cyclotella cryptica TaxID=29204 RepID=A0ABD3QRX9_9STRA|eukprot:CCRYP_002738-RA/>CCRYP_002738-RA protein AED:0.30 eAED:0.30 QI:0/-1/0/1/-1/1/1/0/158
MKFLIASILLLQAIGRDVGSVSAFGLSRTSTTASHKRTATSRRISHRMYVKKQSKISGIGGIGGPKPIASRNGSVGGDKKNTSKRTSKISKKTSASAKPAKGTAKSVFSRPALSSDTPWSTILVAFLNPLRNPNSLFLYLLLIVSVLGKLNEGNVGSS